MLQQTAPTHEVWRCYAQYFEIPGSKVLGGVPVGLEEEAAGRYDVELLCEVLLPGVDRRGEGYEYVRVGLLLRGKWCEREDVISVTGSFEWQPARVGMSCLPGFP